MNPVKEKDKLVSPHVPRSWTVYPPIPSMSATMSLPMSWMSPRTVPMTTVPSSPSCSFRFPRGALPAVRALHDLAAHDELGDERLAGGVAAAYRLHRHAALGDDGKRVLFLLPPCLFARASASSMRRPTIASFNS